MNYLAHTYFNITVSCVCGWFHKLTDPYDSRQLTLNAKAVLGMKLIGKGQKSLGLLCAMMDLLPGLGPRSFSTYVSKLLVSSSDLVRKDQLDSVQELRAFSISGKLFTPPPPPPPPPPPHQWFMMILKVTKKPMMSHLGVISVR